MGFKRNIKSTIKIMDHFKGGEGYIRSYPILRDDDEMYEKGRVFSYMVLEKGCERGKHTHEGDGETFLIVKGHGRYLLNGEMVDVGPGDVLFCDNGETHYMINESEEPLEYIALVLYK